MLLAGGGALLAGCHNGSPTSTTTAAGPSTGSTQRITTKTTVITRVIHDQCKLGVPVTFSPGLKLVVSKPTDSTGPLGTGNGYNPKYGYYVTFQVSASDVGTQEVDLDPGNDYAGSHTGFVVNETGDDGVTVNAGNTPFDGSLTQLDTTFLEPGNSDAGPVTFDVPHIHGNLTYVVSGHLVCTWPF